MPTLLDTHAWIWWVTADRRLSKPARRAIEQGVAEEALWLSLISVWAKKVEKGQLVLDRPVGEWLDVATVRPGLHLAELARPILVESCRLPQPFPGDPADQIIVATARQQGADLGTKDRQIRKYPQVKSI
jgi:PIN domain nuclease of toxin-antitoxin system